MCGRFQLMTDKDLKEINWIVSHLEEEQRQKIKTGEIFPTNVVPVLMKRNDQILPWPMIWGFPHFKGSGVIINARSETAAEKAMFRRSVREFRCVIPGTGFFEWKKTRDKSKEKYLIRMPKEPVLYMAGLYREYEEGDRFVILTTEANRSMEGIHDRMPLILKKPEIRSWFRDDHRARQLLEDSAGRPELTMEQMIR